MNTSEFHHNYCWIAQQNPQRLTHAYFRRELELAESPSEAAISIHASTMYMLYVNGIFIGTGPARAYPEFPEYDTYDLTSFLRQGENVIAVNVAHHGMSTFHHLLAPAGFAAVGSVGETSLDTPGDWLCRESAAYNTSPQRFSFAIGPVQTFDARRENGDWMKPGPASGDWKTPTPVSLPENWTFSPRSIAYLTNDEILPTALLSANCHESNENYYSLYRFADFDPTFAQPSNKRCFVYTYIYSPTDQSVDFGCWWGEYFLNGERVPVADDKNISFRQQGTLDLNEGWNFFLFSVTTVKDVCELHLGFPKDAELILSPEKSSTPETTFRLTPPLELDFADSILANITGKGLDQLPELAGTWEDYAAPEIPEASIKQMSWVRFGQSLDVKENQRTDIVTPAQTDASLVFDMGVIQLGRIFVEYDAPAGTLLDIGYAEELFDGRPNYGKNHLVNSVERQICSDGSGRLETFAPRGSRYLQLMITNHSGPVTIKRIGMTSQVYPYERKGEFRCSDENFSKLYEWGYKTLQLCSEDVITDCPWRERTLYGGDLYPEAATALVMTGDLRLVKRCLELFLQSQSEDPGWLQSKAPTRRDTASLFDYPPMVLLNTEWYCRLTGDVAFAKRAYPVFKKMLDHALSIRDDSGLFGATYRVFIEHGYPIGLGKVTAFNALMAQTFDSWASLLNMLDQPDESATAETIAEEIRQAIPANLWDDTAAAYLDGITEAGPTPTHGIAANSWPKLFADDHDDLRWSQALDHMKRLMQTFDPMHENKTVSSYGAFYFLGALYKAGETAFAEECIQTIYADHIKHPTGTIWEHANPTKSLVHAWSTAPNFYFATRVLGVQLGFPELTDLSKITISPESETLDWAEGKVPHPIGTVTVSWKVAGNKLLLDYEAPEGVDVEVSPRGRLAQLELVCNSAECVPA